MCWAAKRRCFWFWKRKWRQKRKRESGPEPSSSSTVRKRTRSRSGAENGGSSPMSKRTKVRRLQDDDVPELNNGKRVLDDNVDDSDSIEVIEIEEEVSDNSNGKEMEYMKTDKEVEVIDLHSGEDEMETDPDDKNWGFDESNPIVLTESSEDSDSDLGANADSENGCVAVIAVCSQLNDEDFRVDESNEENDVEEDSVCKSKRADGKRKKKSSQVHSNKFEYFHDNDYLGETMPALETESSGICRKNGASTLEWQKKNGYQNGFSRLAKMRMTSRRVL
ncbi:hypothetical protein L6164_002129 [Bauhinia variegata]|uniref:Uncharacterized protein n=1 Tax=Bauhinia variegata TaxID=167791 RepID=A0ACB9PWF6_BAUVA|nr:hypothetical protein L6164_002129 [Bauhinia variegata]